MPSPTPTHARRCHSVAGISQGQRAPDLSDLGSRPTLGSGVLVNDSGAILRWLQEHQRLKPGTGMPSTEDVAPAELETIARWLEGLAP
ncbi:MAG: cytochrome c, partial [Gammaproteobacteria bacterium]|nr:cytochrome c [Gammaproteobacteria bacterium]